MGDLTILIRKRGTIKAQLTRFKTHIDAIPSATRVENTTAMQMSVRLSTIEPLLEEFNQIQFDIESLQTSEVEVTSNLAERDTFESLYYDYVAKAKGLIVENDLSRSDTQAASRPSDLESFPSRPKQIQLPTIKLPIFSGDYEGWLEFRDTFRSLIHDDAEITGIQKFHYLRASLKGEACNIIQSLQLSDDNYVVAWKALLDRYDNKRLIVHNHVKALFNLPTLAKESHVFLRHLLDGVSKHLRALEILGQSVQDCLSHTLLIYVITNKLDQTSKREWESYKIDGEFPTIDDVKTFLKNKCELLETLNHTLACTSAKPKFQKAQNPLLTNTFVSTKSDAVSSIKQNSCAFCKQSHLIYTCKDFKNLPTNKRIEEVKNRKLCLNCLKENHFGRYCKSRSCRDCGRKHHSLLHLNFQRVNDQVNDLEAATSQGSSPEIASASSIVNHSLCNYVQQILLSTALVGVQDELHKTHNCRALLDSGSQSNFISQELCNFLRLKKTRINFAVTGISQIATKLTHKVDLTIRSNHGAYKYTISCIVIPKITGNIPSVSFNKAALSIPQNINLADKTFNISGNIDLLIGAQIFYNLLCTGQIKLENSELILQKTKLGWVLAGPLSAQLSGQNKTICNLSVNSNLDIQEQLSKFWELEECPKGSLFSHQDKFCENYFLSTTTRGNDGRFFVSIPLKDSITKLGDSKDYAINRFRALENRLQKNPWLKQKYTAFMSEYEGLGHMTKVPDCDVNATTYYLPHHGVRKEDSLTTKLRVVFDGSAKSDTGVSLNDIQMVGPVIQEDLFSILIRFRKHKYAMCADVAKMYRQVFVQPEQRDLQRIIWRPNPSEPLSHYTLNTVTYGTAAASFLAIRCLQQLGHESAAQHPRSSSIIRTDFYVDDLLTGADSIEEAVKIREEITEILQRGCFLLRKWVCNEPQILKDLCEANDSAPLQLGDHENTKTLGLIWLPKSDIISYNINVNKSATTATKRSILADTARIFDPLGLLAPSIIIPKMILQELWQYKLSWDESIPSALHTKWLRFQNQIKSLREIRISRHALISNAISVEIHGFSDASEVAYGACVYLRSTDASGKILVKLLCAKSRVAPIRSVSIPRLELCGALLLARLTSKVSAAIRVKLENVVHWSDSTVALAWIKTPSNTLKTFVANRVSEIQELTVADNWRHVSSQENPADLISRGLSPKHLINSQLWWNGPGWLSLPVLGDWPSTVPSNFPNSSPYVLEMRQQAVTLTALSSDCDLFERFSSLTKLQRCLAYCLRFKNNALRPRQFRLLGTLSVNELSYALQVLIKVAQREIFKGELVHLKQNKAVPSNSKLLSLNPFIDQDGLLRVGGRLQNSNFGYDKKHPIILPSRHLLTGLLVKWQHKIMLHAGPQALLAALRENYWPLGGRNLVRRIVHDCVTCFRAKPKVENHLMGSLPKDRIAQSPPFNICGVDYCGPILIKDRRGRGCKSTKSYICIFICFVVKAVHLELVSDLTAESFLASLRRFTSRRGKPAKIYSDNGTNFVGAYAELKKFLRNNKGHIEDSLSSEGISWHFIPPRSPHFGGLWEAGVRSVKFHLKRVVGNALLTYDELYTLMTQIEAVINSRPLCPLSCDPNDLCPLTPAHFLIGRSLMAVQEPNLIDLNEGRLSRFQRVQQIMQNFWSRWSKEYVGELQTRSKWKTDHSLSVAPGAMVLLREDNLPPLKWRLGRIVETHPGRDGVIRVVTVKCGNSTHKRAVAKLCVLPAQ